MPKIAKHRTVENRPSIERAALELFTTQGFHGTRNDEIARKIGVSVSAIYTYVPNKEAIFASLAHSYQQHMQRWMRQTVRSLREPFSKDDLQKFVVAAQSKIRAEPEFLLMILSDVIAFENRHFTVTFSNWPRQLRRQLGPQFDDVTRQPGWRGHDPGFVLASIYMYYFTHALVTQLMQGEQHLGMDNEAAIDRFVDLVSRGRGALTRQASADGDAMGPQ